MIGNWFLRAGVLFSLAGMGLGLHMGASHDFTFAPVHAHINLVGWASMFLAGLFYRSTPAAATGLAKLHFVIAVVGLLFMAPGIAGVLLVKPWGDPLVGIGSILVFAGQLLFAFIVFRNTRAQS